ncbi:PREDICTED: uncharacterized protein LOC108558432, partial [Nicrophorus vespilloides]|uniref:Uncharacterized protein LOC108558432 n=1 Tax=Nicrophorus vespilloides TaxID=110193 RepID=A0ABM1M8D5_NICVS
AVVVAFFICWAPFHAQRLLAVYLATASPEAQAAFLHIYTALMYISGVLYFLSTTVNPVLYHIMSNKFREAFKNTFYAWFGGKKMVRGRETTTTRTYSMLSRCPPSLKKYQRSISDGVANCQQLPLNPHDEDSDDKQISGNGKVDRFRPRMLSQTSQTTMLTTISKSISVDGGDRKKPEPRRHEDIGNRKYLDGFSKIFSLLHSPYEAKNSTADSANNTISNSSLQDLEEIEFSSSDLVRYMEEVNEDLI